MTAAVKRSCALLAMCCVLQSPSAAAARPIELDHWEDRSTEVITDFCGTLTVRLDFRVRGSFLLVPHAASRLAYAMDHFHGSVSYTNLANDRTLTEMFNNVVKDLKVTNNGDGTLTILVNAAGSNKVYVEGKLMFVDTGQVRFAFVVDHSGTPRDPSDDEFVTDLGVVKESTGRNDLEDRDFCEDIREFIG
jgi:hypothetical protein